MDVFDYLPLGGIAVIHPPGPINLSYPQHAASLQRSLNKLDHGQASYSMDGSRSQVVGHSVGVG